MAVEEDEVLPPGAKNSKATVEVVRGGTCPFGDYSTTPIALLIVR
jgi:hypothetical protein